MNRRTLAALAIILVLCGAAALVGGRRLGGAGRPESRAPHDLPTLTPAAAESDLKPMTPQAACE